MTASVGRVPSTVQANGKGARGNGKGLREGRNLKKTWKSVEKSKSQMRKWYSWKLTYTSERREGSYLVRECPCPQFLLRR